MNFCEHVGGDLYMSKRPDRIGEGNRCIIDRENEDGNCKVTAKARRSVIASLQCPGRYSSIVSLRCELEAVLNVPKWQQSSASGSVGDGTDCNGVSIGIDNIKTNDNWRVLEGGHIQAASGHIVDNNYRWSICRKDGNVESLVCARRRNRNTLITK